MSTANVATADPHLQPSPSDAFIADRLVLSPGDIDLSKRSFIRFDVFHDLDAGRL